MNTQRPTIFKMASELKANEEGMSQILGVNDSLIRVIDFYQRTVGENGPADPSASSTAAAVSTAPDVSSTTEKVESSGNAGDSGATASGDLLIELADLNFGNPPAPTGLGSGLGDLSGLEITSSSGAGSAGAGDLSGLGSTTGSSSVGGGSGVNLLDDLGLPG